MGPKNIQKRQNVYLIIENATDILNQLRHFNHAISALLKLRGDCVESEKIIIYNQVIKNYYSINKLLLNLFLPGNMRADLHCNLIWLGRIVEDGYATFESLK